MNDGISLDEACAYDAVGTREDFERLCNEDGTVKEHQQNTTTFSFGSDGTNSITISNTHLQIAIICILIIAIVVVGVLIRKFKKKKS